VKSVAGRLRAALAATLVQAEAPELALVHRWLDNWRGVGLLAVGLHRTGYDLDLRQYGDGHWRATFYVTGLAHSILGGSAWEPTMWRAVPGGQRRGVFSRSQPSPAPAPSPLIGPPFGLALFSANLSRARRGAAGWVV